MSITAIGDVHGCAKTLVALLDRLELTSDDLLIFVGDYIDRGPDSYGVIELLLQMEKESTNGTGPKCVFLRGNHDQMMLDAVDYPTDKNAQELWQINGGVQTMQRYANKSALPYPAEHIGFLRRTKFVFESGDFVFVHAGLNPDLTIEQNLTQFDPAIALWTRAHFNNALDLWEKTVVCGHTPKPEPVNDERLINIDTGAVYPHIAGMGRLTAVRLPEREFVMVDNQEGLGQ